MKTWQKGAIVGGIWGLISLVLGFYFAVRASEFGAEVPLYQRILLFPLFSFWDGLGLRFLFSPFNNKPFVIEMGAFILLPISIGVSIGSLTGYIIDKHKNKIYEEEKEVSP